MREEKRKKREKEKKEGVNIGKVVKSKNINKKMNKGMKMSNKKKKWRKKEERMKRWNSRMMEEVEEGKIEVKCKKNRKI